MGRWCRSLGLGIALSTLAVITACNAGPHPDGPSKTMPSTPGATAPPPTTAPVASTTTASTAESRSCRPGDLSVTASAASGAGGHLAVVVVFTNTSSTPCTAEGYPDAWFVGATGAQIGPASLDEGGLPAPTVVSVAPGAQAATTVWYDSPGVVSPPCPMTTATGVHVALRGQATGLVATIAIQTCSTGTRIATTPLIPGTGETPF